MLLEIGAMHDTGNMAAIQATINVSPLGPTSVIKPITSLIKESEPTVIQTLDRNMIDDDDFSDHDSHYSEDFLDDTYDDPLMDPQPPDVTKRLLGFAEMVNSDIQKYFGRKKEEDSCDIYEDKWATTKSGRELYYADLVKIAQGENTDSKKNADDDEKKSKKYTGKMDTKLGLGPLNELFEYGLRHYLTEQKQKSKKNVKRLKQDLKKFEEVVPMQQRKLPDSFWKEPGSQRSGDRRAGESNLLNTSQPPDFSDLLHNWTAAAMGEDEFNGEMSSDMSVGSSESL